MQRFVDNMLAVTKESVKTVTYESLNNIARLINGFSALLLTFLPGKATILEGVHGWELRPTFCSPLLPRWMENSVSSFNQFIYQLAVNSDTLSSEESNKGDSVISPKSSHSDGSAHYHLNTYGDHWTHWLEYMLSWIFFPVKVFLGVPLFLYNLFIFRGFKALTSRGNHHCRRFHSPRKVALRDHMVNRATDKRRGVMEDLHLGVEILIESVFDGVHKAIDFIFSPSEVMENLFRFFRSCIVGNKHESGELIVSVPTDTLGDSNPATTERKTTFHRSLNTDSRRCQDVIKELGYPYEEIRVVTDDGYVLLLERIPRRDARKVVYLQHGLLDSSMGWVCNGIVGSPAFAAFDQGYDVFLGNFRGLVSREHVNKTLSSRQYWRYSINEHGTKDIPSVVEKIHDIKTSELKTEMAEEETDNHQPYELCSVSHSLGGAAVLMYVITRNLESKPHHLSRLVLLSPAGFHGDSNMMFSVLEWFVLPLAPLMESIFPGLYIPTRFLRMLVNKLARDFHNYPAVGGLVQTIMSYILGGDSSDWVGALGLPHYNMNDMPGLSSRVALHLAQMKRSGRFVMYDYGTDSANVKAYASPEPLDLGKNYKYIDIPVDLMAGGKDRVIRPSMVKKHYELMKETGVKVSYTEFEYAHLDFTFSHSEELLAYVMSRVLLPTES